MVQQDVLVAFAVGSAAAVAVSVVLLLHMHMGVRDVLWATPAPHTSAPRNDVQWWVWDPHRPQHSHSVGEDGGAPASQAAAAAAAASATAAPAEGGAPPGAEPSPVQPKASPMPTLRLTVQSSSRLLMFGERAERTGDWCKGLSHTRSSLSCAVFCAFALNRSLVLDRIMCLSSDHVGRNVLRPLSLYFDVDGIAGLGVAIVYRDQLPQRSPLSAHMPPPSTVHDTSATSAPTANAPTPPAAAAAAAAKSVWKKSAVSTSIVLTEHANDDANLLVVQEHRGNYAFQMCYVPQNKALMQRIGRRREDWLPYNAHLQHIARDIVATLTPLNYTAVHVRRGDKARDKNRWPHLDRDTRPDQLLRKLPRFVADGSHLYIASEEPPPFFEPLRAKYTLHFLADFSHLWGPGSAWHSACKRVIGGKKEPEFDSYMKAAVDYTVTANARKKVETFNDLTADHK